MAVTLKRKSSAEELSGPDIHRASFNLRAGKASNGHEKGHAKRTRSQTFGDPV